MESDIDLDDSLEACRTCGVFYLTSSNYLRSILNRDDPEMLIIFMEIAGWNIEVKEDDDLPQRICHSCVQTFKKFFKFRELCLSVQRQLLSFSKFHTEAIQIKAEKPDSEDESCDIIYVDDLSDGELENKQTLSTLHTPTIKKEPIDHTYESSNLYETMSDKCGTSYLKTPPHESNENHYCMRNAECSLYTTREIEFPNLQNVIESLPHSNSAIEFAPKCETSPNVDTNSNNIKRFQCQICDKIFEDCTLHRISFHLKWHARYKNHSRISINLQNNIKADHRLNRLNRRHKYIPAKNMKRRLRTPSSQVQEFTDVSLEENFEKSMHAQDYVSNGNCEEAPKLGKFVIMCSQCDQRFQSADDLMIHAKIHKSRETNDGHVYTYRSNDTHAENTSDSYEEANMEIAESPSDLFLENTNSVGDSDLNTDSDNEYASPIEEDVFKPFICAHCTESFQTVDELRIHSENHTKKFFKCHICDKVFDLKFSLNRHLKVHRTEST